MRPLRGRLEKLEAQHGKDPLVIIIRDLSGRRHLLGYEPCPSELGGTVVRRIGEEADEALLARATAAAVPGEVIVLQELRG